MPLGCSRTPRPQTRPPCPPQQRWGGAAGGLPAGAAAGEQQSQRTCRAATQRARAAKHPSRCPRGSWGSQNLLSIPRGNQTASDCLKIAARGRGARPREGEVKREVVCSFPRNSPRPTHGPTQPRARRGLSVLPRDSGSVPSPTTCAAGTCQGLPCRSQAACCPFPRGDPQRCGWLALGPLHLPRELPSLSEKTPFPPQYPSKGQAAGEDSVERSPLPREALGVEVSPAAGPSGWDHPALAVRIPRVDSRASPATPSLGHSAQKSIRGSGTGARRAQHNVATGQDGSARQEQRGIPGAQPEPLGKHPAL